MEAIVSFGREGGEQCQRCGTPDRPSLIPGLYDDDGNQVIDHFVRLDMRYWEPEHLPQRLREQGWRVEMFQGRRVIIRYLCMQCIDEAAETEEVWNQLKAEAARASQDKKPESFYYHLAGE
jgi:hypothetical protein